eukprot:1814364-Amphidinium_carterae.1
MTQGGYPSAKIATVYCSHLIASVTGEKITMLNQWLCLCASSVGSDTSVTGAPVLKSRPACGLYTPSINTTVMAECASLRLPQIRMFTTFENPTSQDGPEIERAGV